MFEVGQFYLWGNDIVTPYFKPETNPEESEYAKDGFTLKYGNKTIAYKKNVVSPMQDKRCQCISLNPLTFEVDQLYSPVFEEEVKWKQYDVIKQTLKTMIGVASDLDMQVIAEVAIPWGMKDLPITSEVIIKTLSEYFEENVSEEYSGSHTGYVDHEKKLQNALTVVLGHKIAYAVMKLKDSCKVSVKWNKDRFTAYIDGDTTLASYISNLEGVVGVRTSEKDNILSGILNSAKGDITKEDISDDVTTFINWYSMLNEDTKSILSSVSSELAEAAAHNDRVTITRYGKSGLRKTMWLIYQTIGVGAHRDMCNFYDDMYKHVSSEGWIRLSIDHLDLFGAVCNRSSITGNTPEQEAVINRIPAVREELNKYFNKDKNYCQ